MLPIGLQHKWCSGGLQKVLSARLGFKVAYMSDVRKLGCRLLRQRSAS